MAKNKRSKKRPQPEHKKKSKSQHDKRKRLQRPNPNRKKTASAKIPLTGAMRTAVAVLQAVMDPRIAFRLAIIFAGMFLAGGRRTASAWFAAAGVQDDWDRFYDCLISVGRTSAKLATAVLGLVVQKFAPGFGDRILLAMDDSPTSRYGKHVEGAGVHHNPTPGPADGEWLYGHNWVALAWLERHPVWGAGQQQVRNVWSNIGCWQLNQWLYTLVELCRWDMPQSELSDRRDRPWDNAARRPSHADRRRSISREMLHKEFLAALPSTPNNRKIQTLVEALIALAT